MNPSFLNMIHAASVTQLKRFAAMAAKNMKAGLSGWGDIWLVAEGELVSRELWPENK